MPCVMEYPSGYFSSASCCCPLPAPCAPQVSLLADKCWHNPCNSVPGKVLLSMASPSNIALVFHVDSNEVAKRNPRVIKRDFTALRQLVAGLGARAVFSSVFPVAGINTERNTQTQQMNKWLRGWCHQHGFGFLAAGKVYMTPSHLGPGGKHLSQRRKRIFVLE